MGPKSQYFYGFITFKNLINQAMLNVDTSGIGPLQIPYQFFIGRRILKRILAQYFKPFLGLAFEARASQLLGIFLSLSWYRPIATLPVKLLATIRNRGLHAFYNRVSHPWNRYQVQGLIYGIGSFSLDHNRLMGGRCFIDKGIQLCSRFDCIYCCHQHLLDLQTYAISH